MKRLLMILLLAVCVTVSFTACRKTDKTETAEEPQEEEKKEQAETENMIDEGPFELTIEAGEEGGFAP